jgi:hypothetical protein
MQWWLTIVRAVFFLCLGLTLCFGPWGTMWHQNFFVAHYRWAAVLSDSNFVRGAISGIGLTNIYLAIEEFRPRNRRRSERAQAQ